MSYENIINKGCLFVHLFKAEWNYKVTLFWKQKSMPQPKAVGSESSSRQQILGTQAAGWTSKSSTGPEMQKSLERDLEPIREAANDHVLL